MDVKRTAVSNLESKILTVQCGGLGNEENAGMARAA